MPRSPCRGHHPSRTMHMPRRPSGSVASSGEANRQLLADQSGSDHQLGSKESRLVPRGDKWSSCSSKESLPVPMLATHVAIFQARLLRTIAYSWCSLVRPIMIGRNPPPARVSLPTAALSLEL